MSETKYICRHCCLSFLSHDPQIRWFKGSLPGSTFEPPLWGTDRQLFIAQNEFSPPGLHECSIPLVFELCGVRDMHSKVCKCVSEELLGSASVSNRAVTSSNGSICNLRHYSQFLSCLELTQDTERWNTHSQSDETHTQSHFVSLSKANVLQHVLEWLCLYTHRFISELVST